MSCERFRACPSSDGFEHELCCRPSLLTFYVYFPFVPSTAHLVAGPRNRNCKFHSKPGQEGVLGWAYSVGHFKGNVKIYSANYATEVSGKHITMVTSLAREGSYCMMGNGKPLPTVHQNCTVQKTDLGEFLGDRKGFVSQSCHICVFLRSCPRPSSTSTNHNHVLNKPRQPKTDNPAT